MGEKPSQNVGVFPKPPRFWTGFITMVEGSLPRSRRFFTIVLKNPPENEGLMKKRHKTLLFGLLWIEQKCLALLRRYQLWTLAVML